MSSKFKFNIEIITGPMFAGKTTYIINEYKKYNKNETIVFNHTFDTRYFDTKDVISTHNRDTIPCIKAQDCDSIYLYLITNCFINNIKNIIIDECQFFTDIYKLINLLNKSKLPLENIILAGLNLDAKGNIFNIEFKRIFQYANKIHMLEAKCYKCEEPAQYSICLVKNNLEKNNVLVGNNNIYQPSCEKHINY